MASFLFAPLCFRCGDLWGVISTIFCCRNKIKMGQNRLCPYGDSNELSTGGSAHKGKRLEPVAGRHPVSSDSNLNTVEIVKTDLNKICILRIICNWLMFSHWQQELGPCRTNTSSSNNFDLIRFITRITVQIFAITVKCWFKRDWTISFQGRKIWKRNV